tara:strand:- start:17 stop:313 length:297 start_codon:yes stop_codon:yes gene_type:complete
MIDGKLNTEVSRGQQAKALLENKIFTEAFKEIHDKYLDAWRHSAPSKAEDRENIWMMVKTLDAILEHIATVMTTGKMAEQQLEALENIKEDGSKKRWL